MEIWQAAILGLVQGLGEFLPISSSAHLILAPRFFNFPDPGLAFDAVLHLGTLTALLAFFWRDWAIILKEGLKISNIKYQISNKFKIQELKDEKANSDTNELRYEFRGRGRSLLLWWLLLASIPGAVAGFFLESQAETIFRSPRLIALTLAGFGIILWLAQRFAKNKQISFWSAIWIGLAQVLAIIPGVSRSGATISAAMFLGLSKAEAARFSFLLAMPIVLGAGIFSLRNIKDIWQPELVVGFLFAAISGFLAIKFLLKWLQKADFKPFVVYRLILALVILISLAVK